jgi:hypothetical protein
MLERTVEKSYLINHSWAFWTKADILFDNIQFKILSNIKTTTTHTIPVNIPKKQITNTFSNMSSELTCKRIVRSVGIGLLRANLINIILPILLAILLKIALKTPSLTAIALVGSIPPVAESIYSGVRFKTVNIIASFVSLALLSVAIVGYFTIKAKAIVLTLTANWLLYGIILTLSSFKEDGINLYRMILANIVENDESFTSLIKTVFYTDYESTKISNFVALVHGASVTVVATAILLITSLIPNPLLNRNLSWKSTMPHKQKNAINHKYLFKDHPEVLVFKIVCFVYGVGILVWTFFQVRKIVARYSELRNAQKELPTAQQTQMTSDDDKKTIAIEEVA